MPLKRPRAAWTVMVYGVGGSDRQAAVLADLGALKRVGSTAEVNVVAEVGRDARRAGARYFLCKGTTLAEDIVAEHAEGEGDPPALHEFIVWAARRWPSQRLLLVISDRRNVLGNPADRPERDLSQRGPEQRTGLADRGRATPARAETLSRIPAAAPGERFAGRSHDADAVRFGVGTVDIAASEAMKRALLRARRDLRQTIDVIGMDGGLPVTLEVAHQLRGGAHYLVGSQLSASDHGWPYQTLLAALAARPQMTAAALATLIVRNYLAAYASHDEVAQSAISLARGLDAAASVGGLAHALQVASGHAATRIAIMQARAQVQCCAAPDSIDLADLCDRLQATMGTATPVGRACRRVLASLAGKDPLVVASGRKGAALRYARGIAVHFPTTAVSPLYAKLDGPRTSGWAAFLRTYIAATRRRT